MSHSQKDRNESARSPVGGVGVVRILASWTIASISLALLAGFGYWAVSLGTRNPNEVPIIRAMEGPARIQPEDPGGKQASHQGLAVNLVQAEGSVQAPSERVVLAPPPDALSPEDVAGASIIPPARPAIAGGDIGSKQPLATKDLVIAAILQDQAQPTATTPKPALVKTKNIHGTAYSPDRSLRPEARPARLAKELGAIVPTSASSETDMVASVQSVPIGTRLVQLGAYDSIDLAKSEWATLFVKHSDLLDNKKRLIQSAESGGRKFYRLRAVGFTTLDESQSLCSALLARGTPCIPVTER